jgi:hypothetical protein
MEEAELDAEATTELDAEATVITRPSVPGS